MKSIWFENGTVKMIDQTGLPFEERVFESKNYRETIEAIKEMRVRGAPAIGMAGAYALAQAKISGKNIAKAVKEIKSARPTAVDLQNAVEWVEKQRDVVKASEEWAAITIERIKKVAENGAKLIPNGAKILTHCNTGFLACGKYGTALGAIVEAAKTKNVFVWVSETRPRMQGALTSWELRKFGVKHKVVVDNARGILMKNGEVDLVMVGADRIVRNGDIANKVGTYEIAVVAKENKIPFYVLAPSSSFDKKTKSGKDIVVEERDKREVLKIREKRIYGKNTTVYNPAFDITPAKYITGYVTEKGIFRSAEQLWKSMRG